MSRVAVVTGGASGIGLGIGRRLAATGNRVALFDRQIDAVHVRLTKCRCRVMRWTFAIEAQ